MQIALVYHIDGPPRRTARIGVLRRVLEARGHRVTAHDSHGFRHERDAAGADLICIAGGDGTARLVLDGQEQTADMPPIAVYPAGTINLLARELGYPAAPHAFIKRIEDDSRQFRHRLSTINGRPFLSCSSMGFDAHVVSRVSPVLKQRIGRFAYVAAMAGLTRQWPRQTFRITSDGHDLEAEALFVLRGTFYAGPWKLDPQSGLRNDRLHVLALPRATRGDFLRLGSYAMTGSRRPARNWQFLRLNQLKVSAHGDTPVQADGDILTSGPIDVRLTADTVCWR